MIDNNILCCPMLTEKEAIRNLEILKDEYKGYEGDIDYGYEVKRYEDTMLAIDMAINVLKQKDALNKTREEIKIKCAQAKKSGSIGSVLQMNAYIDCLQIIDKYKVESEE